MTRQEQLKAAVAEAYKNAMEGGYAEVDLFTDEELAGEMIAYDNDVAHMVEGDPEEGLGYEPLRQEIAALLPEVKREYAERAGA